MKKKFPVYEVEVWEWNANKKEYDFRIHSCNKALEDAMRIYKSIKVSADLVEVSLVEVTEEDCETLRQKVAIKEEPKYCEIVY